MAFSIMNLSRCVKVKEVAFLFCLLWANDFSHFPISWQGKLSTTINLLTLSKLL